MTRRHPNIRELLRRRLATCDQVVAVADGSDPLTEIDRVRPEFVITDVMMPDVNAPLPVAKWSVSQAVVGMGAVW